MDQDALKPDSANDQRRSRSDSNCDDKEVGLFLPTSAEKKALCDHGFLLRTLANLVSLHNASDFLLSRKVSKWRRRYFYNSSRSLLIGVLKKVSKFWMNSSWHFGRVRAGDGRFFLYINLRWPADEQLSDLSFPGKWGRGCQPSTLNGLVRLVGVEPRTSTRSTVRDDASDCADMRLSALYYPVMLRDNLIKNRWSPG